MKSVLFVLGFCGALFAAADASADFSGDFRLEPPGCQTTGACKLSYDLRYTDPGGMAWLAAAKNITDGASIPRWAQPFVGSPFDPSYLKAAVVHDHYCDRRVRSWRATHRMFYDAMLSQGVPVAKAKLMYYAVYLGGPKWVRLVPGLRCGPNCVFDVRDDQTDKHNEMELGLRDVNPAADRPAEGALGTAPTSIVSRPASYDDPAFLAELSKVSAMLATDGLDIGLEALEQRARQARPNDFFYANTSEIQIESGITSP